MSAPRTRRYSPRQPAEARREQLLDAALGIIARDGYAAVSIEAIAREVDVTRPVVYHQFDGLEPLLLALLDRQEQRAVTALLATLAEAPDGDDPARSLARTITALATMVVSDPLTWAPILAPATSTPAVVRERIRRDRDAIRARVRDLVVSMGPDAVEAELASHAFIALGEYFGRLLLEDPGAVDPATLGAGLAALVLPVSRVP